MILKGGYITYSQMGDPNASIPTPELVQMRPMFGNNVKWNSVAFVSKSSVINVAKYNLGKKVIPIRDCRNVKKTDMKLNDMTPKLTVDPETFKVKLDGHVLTCPPAKNLPLTQRFLFF